MSMVWTAYALSDARLTSLREDESVLGELLEELEDGDDDGTSIDIDQSWNGIFWLLTGEREAAPAPLGDAILGGEELEEEFGYGPPRVLDPQRVAAVARALATVDLDDLRGRFDAAAMNAAGVYPEGIWAQDGVFDLLIAANYPDVRKFYADAAASGSSVLQLLA